MKTLPKNLSGVASMLLGILIALSPADAHAARHKTSVKAKRVALLQAALVSVRAGETELTGERLRATLNIEKALSLLGSTPAPAQPSPTPASVTALRQSLEKAQKDLATALDTMSQNEIEIATPVIGAYNNVDKAQFLCQLQERAAAAAAANPQPTPAPSPSSEAVPAATPAPTSSASSNPVTEASPTPASSPSGGDQVAPVQGEQKNGTETPEASATPAPTPVPVTNPAPSPTPTPAS